MIGLTRKVAVVPLQSEANANYNPFPNDTTTNPTDVEAIKSAFLADPDVLAALKGDEGEQGQQGPQGQAGPAGDSILVRDTDPTDAISSKVGDLYLNTTSGTLYQRSGITQSQFYAAGLQGLVLPNSIWITKGNLKGANGQNGLDGKSIKVVSGSFNSNDYPEGTVIYDTNSSNLYRIDVSNGVKTNLNLGNLRGASGPIGPTGATGANGQDGTKIYTVSALPSNSADVQIYRNGDLMLNTSTGVLYEKSNMTAAQFLIQNSQQGTQGIVLANVVFLTKGNLKGQNGQDGVSAYEILTGTGVINLTNQQIGKTLFVPSDSAITGISYNNVTISGSTVFHLGKTLTNSISRTLGTATVENPHQLLQAFVDEYFVLKNFVAPVQGYWLEKKSLKGDGILNGVDHPKNSINVLPPVGTLYINKSTWAVYERSATEFLTPPVLEGTVDYSDGYWSYIGGLKGADGQDGQNGQDGNNFHSQNLMLEYSDFLSSNLFSNNLLITVLSKTDFGLFFSIAQSGGRFVGFIYNVETGRWDNVNLKLDELIDGDMGFEVAFQLPYGFKNGVDEGMHQLSSLKIFFAGFDYVNFPTRDKANILDKNNNDWFDFSSYEIIRFLDGFDMGEFELPAANSNQNYRNKSFKFIRIEGSLINFSDSNIQSQTGSYLGGINSWPEGMTTRSIEIYCTYGGEWKVIGY